MNNAENPHNNTGGVRFKIGIVAAVKVGFAKVRFDDIDGLVSDWLAITYPKTHTDKAQWCLDVGEHVSTLMDGNMEDGVILGAIYSNPEPPPSSNQNLFAITFSDGGYFAYDKATGNMQMICTNTATIKAAQVILDTPQTTCTGNLHVNGDLSVGGIGTSVGDFTIGGESYLNHEHQENDGGNTISHS